MEKWVTVKRFLASGGVGWKAAVHSPSWKGQGGSPGCRAGPQEFR